MGDAARERAVARFDARESATRLLAIATRVCLRPEHAVAASRT
jgi:hypothetical protein